MKYVLMVDGSAITAPMPLDLIIKAFGSIKSLESSGVRVVRVS